MQFISVMNNRWKKALGASLTIAILSAVAGVGISFFSSDVLAAWKWGGKAEQAFSSRGFGDLLSFESPAATASRLATQKEDAAQSKTENNGQLVKNWKFTQSPILDVYLLSWSLTFEAIQIEGLFTYLDLALGSLSPSFVSFLNHLEFTLVQTLIGFQNFLNSFLPVGFRPPPIPPISPHF